VTLKLTNFVSAAHPMNKKDVIGANATTTIKRSEFGAGKFAPAVADDVTITIALEAIKQ
jgi:polyisoprenoid-binding protein YceI